MKKGVRIISNVYQSLPFVTKHVSRKSVELSTHSSSLAVLYEPRCEKTGLRGFRPGPAQTRLYS